MDDNVLRPARILIRKPTAVPSPEEAAPTFRVDRTLKGLRVGFRDDGLWMSWQLVLGIWREKMEAAGAQTILYQVREHSGGVAGALRTAREKWIAETDCAVVGLGT